MALENKLGITDSSALAREEEKISKKDIEQEGIVCYQCMSLPDRNWN